MDGGAGPRMLRIVSVAFVVVLAIAAAATAGTNDQRRWIVFSANPAGQHLEQLFRIHPAGDGLQQITTGGYSSVAPAFSPNGKRIAFARLGVGILTMNVDGTGLRRLTTNGRDSYPAWSPDGAHIAFVRPYKAEWRINAVSSTGAAERRLRQAPPSGRPSWTPGGLLIPSGGDLLKIDPATGHVQKYYNAEIDAVWGMNSVALSPDRSMLTYVGARNAEPGDKECGEVQQQGQRGAQLRDPRQQVRRADRTGHLRDLDGLSATGDVQLPVRRPVPCRERHGRTVHGHTLNESQAF